MEFRGYLSGGLINWSLSLNFCLTNNVVVRFYFYI